MPAQPGKAAFHDLSKAGNLERALSTFHNHELPTVLLQESTGQLTTLVSGVTLLSTAEGYHIRPLFASCRFTLSSSNCVAIAWRGDYDMPDFTDMQTWTERLSHSSLRAFTDDQNHFWLEQNPSKSTKWAKLAREGHDVAWEFDGPGGKYTGQMLIDGEVYSPSEATKKFLRVD